LVEREAYRSFRDPIHRFIGVNRLEAQLIDSWPFQRLRHIRQLALTSLVYPDAEHRRFSHSLGMMQFGTGMLDALLDKGLARELQWQGDEIQRNRQLLRLACLLHDLGHPPFSHAAEEGSLLPPDMKHENYSYSIIANSEVAGILSDGAVNEWGIAPQEVIGVLQGTSGGILHEIVDGDFDSDKMDYLLRDSWHTGVDYGRFDHSRLVQSFTFRTSERSGMPVLAVEEGGMHAAEAMIAARYWMFTQVYFHDVRRAYDWHLADFVKDLLGETTGEAFYPANVQEYLRWDDVVVLHALRQRSDSPKADRLLRRRHWRVCAQTTSQPEPDTLVTFSRRAEEARRALGPAFVDYAMQHRLKVTRSEDFQVRLEAGGRLVPLCHISPLIRSFQPITQVRLYASPEVYDGGRSMMGDEFAVTREAA
jgi:HD superfamily phosphohydrolase